MEKEENSNKKSKKQKSKKSQELLKDQKKKLESLSNDIEYEKTKKKVNKDKEKDKDKENNQKHITKKSSKESNYKSQDSNQEELQEDQYKAKQTKYKNKKKSEEVEDSNNINEESSSINKRKSSSNEKRKYKSLKYSPCKYNEINNPEQDKEKNKNKKTNNINNDLKNNSPQKNVIEPQNKVKNTINNSHSIISKQNKCLNKYVALAIDNPEKDDDYEIPNDYEDEEDENNVNNINTKYKIPSTKYGTNTIKFTNQSKVVQKEEEEEGEEEEEEEVEEEEEEEEEENDYRNGDLEEIEERAADEEESVVTSIQNQIKLQNQNNIMFALRKIIKYKNILFRYFLKWFKAANINGPTNEYKKARKSLKIGNIKKASPRNSTSSANSNNNLNINIPIIELPTEEFTNEACERIKKNLKTLIELKGNKNKVKKKFYNIWYIKTFNQINRDVEVNNQDNQNEFIFTYHVLNKKNIESKTHNSPVLETKGELQEKQQQSFNKKMIKATFKVGKKGSKDIEDKNENKEINKDDDNDNDNKNEKKEKKNNNVKKKGKSKNQKFISSQEDEENDQLPLVSKRSNVIFKLIKKLSNKFILLNSFKKWYNICSGKETKEIKNQHHKNNKSPLTSGNAQQKENEKLPKNLSKPIYIEENNNDDNENINSNEQTHKKNIKKKKASKQRNLNDNSNINNNTNPALAEISEISGSTENIFLHNTYTESSMNNSMNVNLLNNALGNLETLSKDSKETKHKKKKKNNLAGEIKDIKVVITDNKQTKEISLSNKDLIIAPSLTDRETNIIIDKHKNTQIKDNTSNNNNIEQEEQNNQHKNSIKSEKKKIENRIKEICKKHQNDRQQRYLLIKLPKLKKKIIASNDRQSFSTLNNSIKLEEIQKLLNKLFLKAICRKDHLMKCFDIWFNMTFDCENYKPFNNYLNKKSTGKTKVKKAKNKKNSQDYSKDNNEKNISVSENNLVSISNKNDNFINPIKNKSSNEISQKQNPKISINSQNNTTTLTIYNKMVRTQQVAHHKVDSSPLLLNPECNNEKVEMNKNNTNTSNINNNNINININNNLIKNIAFDNYSLPEEIYHKSKKKSTREKDKDKDNIVKLAKEINFNQIDIILQDDSNINRNNNNSQNNNSHNPNGLLFNKFHDDIIPKKMSDSWNPESKLSNHSRKRNKKKEKMNENDLQDDVPHHRRPGNKVVQIADIKESKNKKAYSNLGKDSKIDLNNYILMDFNDSNEEGDQQEQIQQTEMSKKQKRKKSGKSSSVDGDARKERSHNKRNKNDNNNINNINNININNININNIHTNNTTRENHSFNEEKINIKKIQEINDPNNSVKNLLNNMKGIIQEPKIGDAYFKKRNINYSKEDEINPDVQDIEITQEDDELIEKRIKGKLKKERKEKEKEKSQEREKSKEKNNKSQEKIKYSKEEKELVKIYKMALHILRKVIRSFHKRKEQSFNPNSEMKEAFQIWILETFSNGLEEYRKQKKGDGKENDNLLKDEGINLEEERANMLISLLDMINMHQKRLKSRLSKDEENTIYKKWCLKKWLKLISNYLENKKNNYKKNQSNNKADFKNENEIKNIPNVERKKIEIININENRANLKEENNIEDNNKEKEKEQKISDKNKSIQKKQIKENINLKAQDINKDKGNNDKNINIQEKKKNSNEEQTKLNNLKEQKEQNNKKEGLKRQNVVENKEIKNNKNENNDNNNSKNDNQKNNNINNNNNFPEVSTELLSKSPISQPLIVSNNNSLIDNQSPLSLPVSLRQSIPDKISPNLISINYSKSKRSPKKKEKEESQKKIVQAESLLDIEVKTRKSKKNKHKKSVEKDNEEKSFKAGEDDINNKKAPKSKESSAKKVDYKTNFKEIATYQPFDRQQLITESKKEEKIENNINQKLYKESNQIKEYSDKENLNKGNQIKIEQKEAIIINKEEKALEKPKEQNKKEKLPEQHKKTESFFDRIKKEFNLKIDSDNNFKNLPNDYVDNEDAKLETELSGTPQKVRAPPQVLALQKRKGKINLPVERKPSYKKRVFGLGNLEKIELGELVSSTRLKRIGQMLNSDYFPSTSKANNSSQKKSQRPTLIPCNTLPLSHCQSNKDLLRLNLLHSKFEKNKDSIIEKMNIIIKKYFDRLKIERNNCFYNWTDYVFKPKKVIVFEPESLQPVAKQEKKERPTSIVFLTSELLNNQGNNADDEEIENDNDNNNDEEIEIDNNIKAPKRLEFKVKIDNKDKDNQKEEEENELSENDYYNNNKRKISNNKNNSNDYRQKTEFHSLNSNNDDKREIKIKVNRYNKDQRSSKRYEKNSEFEQKPINKSSIMKSDNKSKGIYISKKKRFSFEPEKQEIDQNDTDDNNESNNDIKSNRNKMINIEENYDFESDGNKSDNRVKRSREIKEDELEKDDEQVKKQEELNEKIIKKLGYLKEFIVKEKEKQLSPKEMKIHINKKPRILSIFKENESINNNSNKSEEKKFTSKIIPNIFLDNNEDDKIKKRNEKKELESNNNQEKENKKRIIDNLSHIYKKKIAINQTHNSVIDIMKNSLINDNRRFYRKKIFGKLQTEIFTRMLEEHNRKIKAYQLYSFYVLFNENSYDYYLLKNSIVKWKKQSNIIFMKPFNRNHLRLFDGHCIKCNCDKINFESNKYNSCLNCECFTLQSKIKAILIKYKFMKEINPERYYLNIWYKKVSNGK